MRHVHMRSLFIRPMHLLVALTLPMLLATLIWPVPARAATITISDQISCEAAGGTWNPNTCFFDTYTLAAGDTLQTNVSVQFESLTNNGTIVANSRLSIVSLTNTTSGNITSNFFLTI